MSFRDFDALYKTEEPIQFQHKNIVYDLPSELSFALEMQVTEYIVNLDKKPQEDVTVDDLKGLYRLIMGNVFDELWNSGISKQKLEAILAYWSEEREKISPKAPAANQATSPQQKVVKGRK